MVDVVVAVLVALALAILLVAAVGVLVVRAPLDKLHFMAPVTSLAVPLFALAAIVQSGLSLGSATIALTAAVVAASGPVLATAIGRAIAHSEGIEVGRSPQ